MEVIGRKVVPFTDAWCIKKDGPIGDNGLDCYLCAAGRFDTTNEFYAVSNPYQEEVHSDTYAFKILFIDVKSTLTGNVYRTKFSEDMFVEGKCKSKFAVSNG